MNLPPLVNIQLPQELIRPLIRVLYLGLDSLDVNDDKSIEDSALLMQVIMAQLKDNSQVEISGDISSGFGISDELAEELGRVADHHQTKLAVTLLADNLARRDLKLPLLDTYIDLKESDEVRAIQLAGQYLKEISQNSFKNIYVVKDGKVVEYK